MCNVHVPYMCTVASAAASEHVHPTQEKKRGSNLMHIITWHRFGGHETPQNSHWGGQKFFQKHRQVEQQHLQELTRNMHVHATDRMHPFHEHTTTSNRTKQYEGLWI